ncbi:hypothetical protein [Mongoliibacter ruber]|uniref:Lipoprotein n=1 Tax=Mongoliibacter ruber TaxID=1750599 RepID=A0A2T0WAR4_9BACT|nr:hypothetical protein [Mongoliibacter ruber]PRY83789.1 hypothetical protein CLW00_1256 [Mongoliibacter ruber]
MRKIPLLLLCSLIFMSLISCDKEDEEVPCSNESFIPFSAILVDEENNNMLEDEDFDVQNLRLVYLNESQDESNLDFKIYKTNEGNSYMFSSAMTQKSLSGENEFFIKLGQETIYELTYKVDMSNDTGCRVYSHEAFDKNGNELEKSATGIPKAYILKINAMADPSMDK